MRTKLAIAAALFALSGVVQAADIETHPPLEPPPVEDPTARAVRLIDAGRPAEAIPLLIGILERSTRDDMARDALKRSLMHPDLTPDAASRHARRVLRGLTTTASTYLALEGEPGEPLLVSGRVLDEQGQPIAGALVYAFQADAEGAYTKVRAMDEPNARLFGFVRTGEDGRYELTTIWPGVYPEQSGVEGDARFIPRHIHLEVTTTQSQAKLRQQLVFADDERMTSYWYEWARKWGHPVVGVVRDDAGPRRAVNEITVSR